jgi:hypothetical protein
MGEVNLEGMGEGLKIRNLILDSIGHSLVNSNMEDHRQGSRVRYNQFLHRECTLVDP